MYMKQSSSSSYTSKAVERFENFSRQTSSYQSSSSSLQKSRSEVLSNRGYKPSDIHNPQAREYLTNLSKRVFHTDENRTKKIDLQKLFTPSTDFEEIKPGKNRKLYASSAFYTPGIHPTVQDQVDLARRISHSLSDISNQKSKGQSMYINRKKRSVKWVHDSNGEDISSYEHESSSKFEDGHEEKSEKTEFSQSSDPKKVPLKLVMNPQGQYRDFSEAEPTVPIISPEPILEALNTPKEKGAELFAKRRKKSDKWIIDETNSEKILKNSSRSSKYFEEIQTSQSTIENIAKSISDMTPITPVEQKLTSPSYLATTKLAQSPTIIPYNGFGGLAYRPRVAQGWNAPPIKLQVGPLEPLTIKTDTPPSSAPATNSQPLLQPIVKRDALNNLSPLPYHQNPTPIPQGLITLPEPEPPKPDYSYEAFLSHPVPDDLEIPTEYRPVDLKGLSSYNTAPRGWGLAKDYYRPIHLDKKFDNLVFSDF